MTDDEQIDFGWNDLVEKATQQGMKGGTTKIPKDVIGKVLDQENPWDKEKTFKIIDTVDSQKDGITKEEYVSWTKYEKTRQTPKADGKLTMCIPKFSQWASDQAKSAAFENCGKLMTETACAPINECEWMQKEFNAHDDWKQIVEKAGLQGEVNDMPRETYLKAAKDLWPHLETKMANWMTQADK
jgi:hypothetical protein